VLVVVCILHVNPVLSHTQNIHEGNASFVSFVDYLAGRNSGLYWPSMPPMYQKKNNDEGRKRIDYINVMREELLGNALDKKMGNSLI
jgi:hypothetical protein